MVIYIAFAAFGFLGYVTFLAMRKLGTSAPMSLMSFFLPIYLKRYIVYLFRGNSRKIKFVFLGVFLFVFFFMPMGILFCRLLYHFQINFEASDFVATHVTTLGWLKPVLQIEGMNSFNVIVINGMFYVVFTFLLNLMTSNLVMKDYSKIIAEILVQFVPGFNSATKMKASQNHDIVTIESNAFADIWTVYSNREKIENRIADRVRIVELVNPSTGVFEFKLGVLKTSRTEIGELISDLHWTDCPQIDSSIDVKGLWTVNIGSNGRPLWLDLRTHPNVLFTGPPGFGKSTASLHLFSVIARQNPQTIFNIVNLSKPSDHASLTKDYYEMQGELPTGGKDPRFATMSATDRFRKAKRLDNFNLFRSEAELVGLVRWLDEELIRRNNLIENEVGANHIYQLAEWKAEGLKDKLLTEREAAIVVNICEYTILRDRYGEKGNNVAEALNRLETIGLEGRNRAIHIIVDSQNATLKVVGYLRRSSMTCMFGVTAAEIEFTFGVKTQPVRGIGVFTSSDERGIKTACSPMIEWHEVSQHITNAERALFKSNRELAWDLRNSVKHEMGEKAQEKIDEGQSKIYESMAA